MAHERCVRKVHHMTCNATAAGIMTMFVVLYAGGVIRQTTCYWNVGRSLQQRHLHHYKPPHHLAVMKTHGRPLMLASCEPVLPLHMLNHHYLKHILYCLPGTLKYLDCIPVSMLPAPCCSVSHQGYQ